MRVETCRSRCPATGEEELSMDITETNHDAMTLYPDGGSMPSSAMNANPRTTREPMTDTEDDPRPTFHPSANGRSMPSDPTNPATHTTTGDPMTDMQTDHDNRTPNGEPMTTELRPDLPRAMPPDDEPIPDTLRMITPDDAARAELNGVAYGLGVDELRVLVRIGERLKLGRGTYGRLYLPTDTRSFRATEARQELEDALVYLACAWLKSELHEVTR
jgi:hypothetical protein